MRTVEQAQQFNSIPLDAIHHNKGRVGNDKFPRIWSATWAAHAGVTQKRFHLLGNMVTLRHSSDGVVLGNVVQLRVPVM